MDTYIQPNMLINPISKRFTTNQRFTSDELPFFLRLHKIVEGLYFHFSLSVCLSVCLCVCPTLLFNKILAKRMHRFGRDFSLNRCFTLARTLLKLVTLG